jgi:hypothetical protein
VRRERVIERKERDRGSEGDGERERDGERWGESECVRDRGGRER